MKDCLIIIRQEWPKFSAKIYMSTEENPEEYELIETVEPANGSRSEFMTICRRAWFDLAPAFNLDDPQFLHLVD